QENCFNTQGVTFIYSKNCLLCKSYKIYKAEDQILFENKNAYSVFSFKPSTPGHALIITKEHIINLESINGEILEDFIHAIPLTFKKIQSIYDDGLNKITTFYTRIISNPPEQYADIFAKKMLKHPSLKKKPIANNWGMNCGHDAGQRAAHLHIHLFPRNKKGLGIATAMRKHLNYK
ncbi:MAG: HIT family protein, partial [Promethearchaeota archaeon]